VIWAANISRYDTVTVHNVQLGSVMVYA